MSRAPQIEPPHGGTNAVDEDEASGWTFVEELSSDSVINVDGIQDASAEVASTNASIQASTLRHSGGRTETTDTHVPAFTLQHSGPMSPTIMHPVTLASPRAAAFACPGDEPEGKGSQLSAIINLLATTMGAGLLSLPRAFAHCGLLPGIALLLICGFAADVSLQFLVVCARGSHRHSFEGNAQHYLGNLGKRCLNTMLLILLFFAAVALVVIISQLLPDFIQEASGHPGAFYGNSYVVAAVCLLAMLPVCLKEEITILRYTSAIALCNLAYYFICLNIRFFLHPGGPRIHETVKYYNLNLLEVMQGFSIMVAAYIGHFNIFKIDAELAKPLKPCIWRVIHIAIPGVATTLYIFGGVLGYFLFGQAVKNNMLEQFPDDPLMSFARLALSLTNLFKLPLIVQPLRESCFEAAPGLPKCTTWATVLLLLSIYTVAMALGSLSKALGILGCTAGMAIAFVLPGLMRLQYREPATLLPTQIGTWTIQAQGDTWARVGAKLLVVGGIAFSLSAVAGNVVFWNQA